MSGKKKLKFAIVGTGTIAKHHGLALKEIPGAELVSFYERNTANVHKFEQMFNISSAAGYPQLLANPDIDVIDITLPSGLHSEYGVKAALAGKHVIVEKPIDVTLEKADALINACKRSGVTLSVISQMRFIPDILQLKKFITEGKLGTLMEGDAYIKWYRSPEYYKSSAWRGTWALDGGGSFINQAIHFIDLLLYIMGPVNWVSAKTRTTTHDIEVEDIGMAMVEFHNGSHGIIQASTAIYPGFPARLEIHGTKGTVIFEGDRISFMHIEGEVSRSTREVHKGGAAVPTAIDVGPFVNQFMDIIDSIHGKWEPKVSGEEARKSLQLILAIYHSSRTGQPVKLI